jgi:hypothetical protein
MTVSRAGPADYIACCSVALTGIETDAESESAFDCREAAPVDPIDTCRLHTPDGHDGSET